MEKVVDGSVNGERPAGLRFGAFRFSLDELGGALGDLGTLLPLVIALISINKLEPTAVFFVIGLTYMLAGSYFRLPIPVQPLKAVSAIAIASGLSAGIIASAGLIMGVITLLLALTGGMTLLAKFFRRSVVRGIQLGLGLTLLKSGGSLILADSSRGWQTTRIFSLGELQWSPLWLIAGGGILLLVLCLRSKRIAASVVLLAYGLATGVFFGFVSIPESVQLGFAFPSLTVLSTQDILPAFVLLVIPQVPLTLANSVVATVDTAKKYFGDEAKNITYRSLLTSMGLANLLAGLIGGMPVCHGSGGLTAHYKLGARTGGANLLIGGLFLALALFVTGNATALLALVPLSILGVLLLYVGLQHALLVADLRQPSEFSVALLVAAVSYFTGNLAIGMVAGLCLIYGLRFVISSFNTMVPMSVRRFGRELLDSPSI